MRRGELLDISQPEAETNNLPFVTAKKKQHRKTRGEFPPKRQSHSLTLNPEPAPEPAHEPATPVFPDSPDSIGQDLACAGPTHQLSLGHRLAGDRFDLVDIGTW